MRLKNILFVVEDIERSKQFYGELFGLRVITDFGENVVLSEGLALQERRLWETFIESEVRFRGNDAELYFEESDLEGFLEKLDHCGWDIKFLDRLKLHDWGQKVIRIYDPDQHIIEIGEPMEEVLRRQQKNELTSE